MDVSAILKSQVVTLLSRGALTHIPAANAITSANAVMMKHIEVSDFIAILPLSIIIFKVYSKVLCR
jgi:hypothetical protein